MGNRAGKQIYFPLLELIALRKMFLDYDNIMAFKEDEEDREEYEELLKTGLESAMKKIYKGTDEYFII